MFRFMDQYGEMEEGALDADDIEYWRAIMMFRFMDQYGEMEEGALDADDIEGTLDEAGERMQQLIRDTQYSINLL